MLQIYLMFMLLELLGLTGLNYDKLQVVLNPILFYLQILLMMLTYDNWKRIFYQNCVLVSYSYKCNVRVFEIKLAW